MEDFFHSGGDGCSGNLTGVQPPEALVVVRQGYDIVFGVFTRSDRNTVETVRLGYVRKLMENICHVLAAFDGPPGQQSFRLVQRCSQFAALVQVIAPLMGGKTGKLPQVGE